MLVRYPILISIHFPITKSTLTVIPLFSLGPGVWCEGGLVREHAPPLVVNCCLRDRQIVVPPAGVIRCSSIHHQMSVPHLIVSMLSKSPTRCLGQEGITIPFLGLLSCAELKPKLIAINNNISGDLSILILLLRND